MCVLKQLIKNGKSEERNLNKGKGPISLISIYKLMSIFGIISAVFSLSLSPLIKNPRLLCFNSRWSRREEADFYKTVSSFGIEMYPSTKTYKWDRFRALARLDKKYDETLSEYFEAFYEMCQQACQKEKEEGKFPKHAAPPCPIMSVELPME